MSFKLKSKQIKGVISQLRKASKTHAAQADKLENIIDSPAKACWKTHVQKGMKKKGNRTVPNCVPRKRKR